MVCQKGYAKTNKIGLVVKRKRSLPIKIRQQFAYGKLLSYGELHNKIVGTGADMYRLVQFYLTSRKGQKCDTLIHDTSLARAIAKAGITKSKASVKSRKSLPSEYEGQALLNCQRPDYHSVLRHLRPSALRPRLWPGLPIALLICCFCYFSGTRSTSPGRIMENRLLLFSRSSSLIEQPSLCAISQKLSPFCTV